MIAAGHPPAAVWDYTPKQIAGFLFFAGKRQNRENAVQLSVGALAARGDPREVKRIIKEAEKG